MNSKTIENISKLDCTGCGLCKEICPKKCISMLPNKEGFLEPNLDVSMCVACGQCFKACPTTAPSNFLNKFKTRYFCANISDSNNLLKSSSGGIFWALAKSILEKGGYVCGCIYNAELVAEHVVTQNESVVKKMFGSKYVQSHVEHCFSKILDLLKHKKIVLFTGTACQIAALKSYLKKDFNQLFCVEILCHGVPSPKFFELYHQFLKKKCGGNIKEILFRDKNKKGWGSEHRMCVNYEKNGTLKQYRPFLPSYFSAFFYGLDLRESCYRCKFSTLQRVADLTIGDFWGSWQKYNKRFNEGISVVAVHTPNGENLTKEIIPLFNFYDSLTEAEAIASNGNFIHPVKRPNERTNFYDFLDANKYNGIWKKTYFTKTYRKKTLASIYGALVPSKIRFFIQRAKLKF